MSHDERPGFGVKLYLGCVATLIVLAKGWKAVAESLFCALPALIGWYFMLGADPRVGSENRHALAMLVACLFCLATVIALLLRGQFRPSPWIYLRALLLGMTVGLLQLAAAEHHPALRLVLASIGFLALVAASAALFRVIANRPPRRALDVALIYGSMAVCMVAAGCYHARQDTLEVDFRGANHRATWQRRVVFGQILSETRTLDNVTQTEMASSFDYGEGLLLISSDNRVLHVPGDRSQPHTIVYQMDDRLSDYLARGAGRFMAVESRRHDFWKYVLAAVILLVCGCCFDGLSRFGALTPDGARDESILSA